MWIWSESTLHVQWIDFDLYQNNFVSKQPDSYETHRLKLSNFLWFLKYELSDTTNG